MASSAGTLLDMADKKKPKKPQGRSPAYTIFARVSPELGEALEAYLTSLRPKPTVTAAVTVAMEEFLAAKGFWPPSSEE